MVPSSQRSFAPPPDVLTHCAVMYGGNGCVCEVEDEVGWAQGWEEGGDEAGTMYTIEQW